MRKITLVIDGREIEAIEGEMLVDAAKHGDVEIPVFCYEPKLGAPVGACRMCMVEIEGMPKLQTACSTPVRDGMVVYTRNEQVKGAQNAVVEFLLVNHPLDCPVCDKGGECPLQDISMGWGHGRSRFTEAKRHFEKPIPLSPLIGIDRERCILCYRCVRFSQEVAEDSQLQLLERGDKSYVGTFDERPYIDPFHGNITELCPVGALTSYTYRFRARPWDIEQAGSVCTLCPSQCNVSFTVRDEAVKRVLARDNPDVDDGWLCDKGRYGFEMLEPARPGYGDRSCAPAATRPAASWPEAIERAAAGLRAAGAEDRGDRRRRLQRGGATWCSGSCAVRSARAHVDSRPAGRAGARGAGQARRPGDLGQGRGHRRSRRDPGDRHRPAPLLADPRPADPQGGAPQRHAGWRSPPTARRPSTAAPRPSPATRPAPPPASSPSSAPLWPRSGESVGPRRRGRRRRSPAPRTWSSSGASGSGAASPARPRSRDCSGSPRGWG